MTKNSEKTQDRLINLTYILGVSLLISAIIYFFAPNWLALGRETKVILVSTLVIGLHMIAWMLLKWMSHRPLIGKLFLFTGTVSFGVAVALIGDLYNSHAEDYLLYFIWFIPVLFMSIITRFTPYDVLAFILFHTTILIYLFSNFRMDEPIIVGLILLSLGNMLFFEVIRRGKLHSTLLYYGSFLMFHIIWWYLSTEWMFESYYLTLNIGYLFILIGTLYLFLKIHKQRVFIGLTGIAIAFYILRWMFRWMWEFDSSLIYLFVLLFATGLVILNIWFIKWITNRMKNKSNSLKEPESLELQDASQTSASQTRPWWQRLLIGVVSITSGILATSAIIGFSVLVFDELLSVFYVAGGLILLIFVSWKHKGMDDTVKSPLVFIGLLIVTLFSWDIPLALSIVVVVLLPFVWNSVNTSVAKSFVLLFSNVYMLSTVLNNELSWEMALILLIGLNVILALGVSRFIDKNLQQSLIANGLFYSLTSFFILTFFRDTSDVIYYLYNIGFFLIVTFLAYQFVSQGKKTYMQITLLFWFAFLVYKFHDYVWLLLHKSIALAIIGSLFLLIGIYFDNKTNKHDIDHKSWLTPKKTMFITIVLCLQIGYIGFQYFYNEQALEAGDFIKLEIDSHFVYTNMDRADSIDITYTISNLKELDGVEFDYDERVKIRLTENENGIYEYGGIYKTKQGYNQVYEKQESDIFINGKVAYGGRVNYGIESYFIDGHRNPDKLASLNYAYIRIASTGNAIIIDVE